MAVRKKTAREQAPGKVSAKRELIVRGRKRYVRRDTESRFKESVDISRSLVTDRLRKARTVAKPGQGDHGDRR
jgi:hypothetical protein